VAHEHGLEVDELNLGGAWASATPTRTTRSRSPATARPCSRPWTRRARGSGLDRPAARRAGAGDRRPLHRHPLRGGHDEARCPGCAPTPASTGACRTTSGPRCTAPSTRSRWPTAGGEPTPAGDAGRQALRVRRPRARARLAAGDLRSGTWSRSPPPAPTTSRWPPTTTGCRDRRGARARRPGARAGAPRDRRGPAAPRRPAALTASPPGCVAPTTGWVCRCCARRCPRAPWSPTPVTT
jgi:hypothetical protein